MRSYPIGKLCLCLILVSPGPMHLLFAQEPALDQAQENQQRNLHTTDYLVRHISTVPANSGERVELFVREKVESRRRFCSSYP